MRAEDIHAHARAQPFQPFRLHLSDGTIHLVRHPEMIIVMRHRVTIAEPSEPGRLPSRVADIAPLHVTHIEVVDEQQPAGSEG